MLPFAIPQLVRRLRRRGSCRNHAQDATNWRKSQPETRVFWLTLTIVADNSATLPTAAEKHQLDDLSRAGKRLMGFCRTNLFKRLESSGSAFLQSVARHALRNYVFLHAITNALPLPLGTQDAELLDSRFTDEDADAAKGSLLESDDDDQEHEQEIHETGGAWTNANFELQAAQCQRSPERASFWTGRRPQHVGGV